MKRHKRPRWEPAADGGAELHAAVDAIALCNTPAGRQARLWIRLCWLRDERLAWTEILPALRQELATSCPVAAE